MGWDRMARKAGMSDKAAKRNLTLLIEKLAVDLIASEVSATRTGRTYRVYSYAAILERRAAAGMLYVIRDKGVRFLTETEVAAFSGAKATGPTDKTSTVDISSTVDKEPTKTGDKTSTDKNAHPRSEFPSLVRSTTGTHDSSGVDHGLAETA
jgi:hypothetical protein